MAAAHSSSFDIVVLADVLHHVPWIQHAELLQQCARLVRPSGAIVVKDWELRHNLVHWFCELSDRYLTGDDVKYGTEQYFRTLLTSVFGSASLRAQARLPPWKNNLILLVRPAQP
jgi:2-polyprenyl-3-methyl-5-hydroxy-6-metoxy-1,4-benzoquinol methylase